jgi:flagellar motility protein MotE (MotC chaperone)
MLTVGYTSFATIACKAIQELKASHDSELSALREEIDEKDERISSLEKRLGALEKLLSHDR